MCGEPRAGCLTIYDREQIRLGIGRAESLSAIARSLGRSPSTITREVNANRGREHYSAWHAHERAREQARRLKPCKLRRGRLLREVSRRLEQLWSPEEIARRLALDYPHDPEMRVSHETIYKVAAVEHSRHPGHPGSVHDRRRPSPTYVPLMAIALS